MDSPRAGSNLDIALALTAGPSAWTSDPPGAVDWAAALTAATGLTIVTADAGFRYVTRPFPWPGRGIALFALVAGAVLVALPEIMRLRDGTGPNRLRLGYRQLLAIRIVGTVLLVGLWSGVHRGIDVFLGWPLGVTAGADAFLTLRALGFTMTPVAFWRTFLTSEVHLGALAALLGLAVTRIVDPLEAFQLLVAAHVALAAAVGTFALLSRADQAERAGNEAAAAQTTRMMRRRLAHWLHDDVCAAIGVLRMRIQAGSIDAAGIPRALEELDHDLRLRQLDEVMEAGSVQLAEILQPFVRKAQALGIDIVETPSFDTARYTLSGDAAWRFRRVISVAVSNAINAGTPWLAIRAMQDRAGSLMLEVEDGAGGFATDQLPLGRGLHMLFEEMAGQVTLESTQAGTLVRARVDCSEGPR